MLRDSGSYARLALADGDEFHEHFVRIEARRPRRLKRKDDACEEMSDEDWNRWVLEVSICYRA